MYSTIVFGVGSVPLNIPQPIVTYKLKSSRFYIALIEYFQRNTWGETPSSPAKVKLYVRMWMLTEVPSSQNHWVSSRNRLIWVLKRFLAHCWTPWPPPCAQSSDLHPVMECLPLVMDSILSVPNHYHFKSQHNNNNPLYFSCVCPRMQRDQWVL